MNIHPLIVHFPIGLLILYAGLEIIRLPWLVRQSWYFHIKAVLAIFGTVAAYAAVVTGGWFEESIPRNADIRPIIEVHEMMASVTATIFTIIALAYVFTWLQKEGVIEKYVARMPWVRMPVVILEKLDRLILCTPVSMILALAGVVAITMTGGLGAAMVYGPDIDPFVKIIYNLFF
jgi:uncharacterized membrane protein